MEIPQLYEIFKQYPIITTDTRNCIKDSIFFALKGANFNGNQYAKKALELGCKYAIVDEPEYADSSLNILLVDDCLKTLQKLANYHRSKFKIPVIGITGTNGKTTSKELITAVLSEEFNVLSTQGNLNNHIGVPLTLLRINKEHEIAVIEMGASHVGEIKVLAEIADPNYGMITNVGRAHIEGFGSFENIIKAKGELYDYIRDRKDGKIFIDYDNHYLREIANDITPIYYGVEEDLFVCGRVESNDPYLTFSWKFSKDYHQVHTNLIGEYNLTNVLAAVSIGKYFGVKTAKIIKAIEEYSPTNNRSQLTKTEKNTLIVDAYNANPTSMDAALRNFAKMNVPNKVLILGDMKELGTDSLAEHQKISDLIASKDFQNVFLIGDNFSKTESTFPRFNTLDDFTSYLKGHPLSEKFILIKGSRGLQLEKCIDLL
jgi:UDP-N-acetylmuramoyl-tripeptide--D-alanyl-D-alanine ligase